MEVLILLNTDDLTPMDVKQNLENISGWSDLNMTLELRSHPNPERLAIETTVLVALVGAASAGLTSLITGLLSIAQKKREMYFELHDKNGRILKVPADISNEKLDQLVERVKRMEIDQIEIGIEPRSQQKRK